MNRRGWMVALLLCVTCSAAGWAEKHGVSIRLLANAQAVAPGSRFSLGVLFRLEPGWHIYWRNPGDAGLATRVRWRLPEGFRAGELRWPAPIRFAQPGDLTGYGYTESVLLFAEVRAPAELPPGGTVNLGAEVSWLGCKEVCVPGRATLSLALPVRARPGPANRELFARWRSRLPLDAGAEGSPVKHVSVESAPLGPGVRRVRVDLAASEGARLVEWFPGPEAEVDQVALSAGEGKAGIAFTARLAEETPPASRMESVAAFLLPGGRQAAVRIPIPLGKATPADPRREPG